MNTIAKLRKKMQMSQEEFAESLNVSKQAVQKWEAGKSLPDLNHLIMLHSRFGVSLDELVFGMDQNVFELRFKPTLPDYAARSAWDEYSKNMPIEYCQSVEEGKNVECYKALIQEVDSLPDSKDKHDLCEVLYRMISVAPQRTGYKYIESSVFSEISSQFGKVSYQKAEVDASKLEGAWTGRIVGCLLGKPVEGVPRSGIRKTLAKSNNYPVKRYILSSDVLAEVPISDCYCADKIDGCPFADDDTDYTVVAQQIVEKYGTDFTSENVLATWCDLLPRNVFCTAERVAVNNYCKGFVPPDTASYKNVFREWIGAQIRGDYFGYICPGNPQKAAELAHKDACVSHVKNGIYGEMFVAALLAIVAVETDLLAAVKNALKFVPYTSRFFEAVSKVVADYENGVSCEKCFDKIFAEYDDANLHHWLHVICNAKVVAASLLYGEGNFTKSIGLAVSAGYDTDCNGATVGSVVGMLKGAKGISAIWKDVLRGKVKTDLRGKQEISVQEFVAKATKHSLLV